MTAVDQELGVNLLAEDHSPVWHTRGQFHASDLEGACGDYPEYGRVRHFRLRGFELTLRAAEVVATQGTPLRLTLGVSLEPNASIVSPVAEQPGYLRPRPGRSELVLRGYDRRMCRTPETFSWEACDERNRE